MQIDKKTNKIERCECGYKPTEYSVGYGRFPYYITCLGCGKSLHNGTGAIDTIIKLWNRKYRHIHAPKWFFDITYGHRYNGRFDVYYDEY